jgi:hypothetical protein
MGRNPYRIFFIFFLRGAAGVFGIEEVDELPVHIHLDN